MQDLEDRLKQARKDLERRRPIVLFDNEGKENEADLLLAAEYVDLVNSPSRKNMEFFLRYTSRVVCAPMTIVHANTLGLELQTERPTDPSACRAYVMVDNIQCENGIDLLDRMRTARSLAYEQVPITDLRSQLKTTGHTIPLTPRDGGILERAGHTEASVYLLETLGLIPVGIISELWDERKQRTLKGPEVRAFTEPYDLTIIEVQELVTHAQKRV